MSSELESALFLEELMAYGLSSEGMQFFGCKGGVTAARVRYGDSTAVLKCFEKEELRREISNYDILQSCGVPTLAVLGKRESSILLEDIACSLKFRLATESDLCDPAVIRAIARWYRALHEKGRAYVESFGAGMYEEWDKFSLDNINAIRLRFGLGGSRGIDALTEHFDMLRGLLDEAPRTLTYNDFYYTNMAVAKDASEALMFDYDMLGKGCAVTDIGNVTYWFSEENKRVFLSEYGGIDEMLVLLDRICAPAVSLAMAVERSEVPSWVNGELAALENVPELIDRLIGR